MDTFVYPLTHGEHVGYTHVWVLGILCGHVISGGWTSRRGIAGLEGHSLLSLLSYAFPQQLPHFTLPPAVDEGS